MKSRHLPFAISLFLTPVLVFSTLLLATSPAGAQQRRTELAGCLESSPGGYSLGAVPSGDRYQLQGNLGALQGHEHQLVRLTGSETSPRTSDHLGAFSVQNVQVVGGTCTPPQTGQVPTRAVTGTTGAASDAVDVTDTRSAGQVTPGVQTQAGWEQEKTGSATGNATPPTPGPLAPPQPGSIGQDQPTADRDAAAAQRAEEVPGHTLGVNAMPSEAKPSPQPNTAPRH